MQTPTLKDLLEMGAHYGHKKELSHPKAQDYVFTISEGINIINLEKTLQGLEVAAQFIAEASKEGKTIVFVGTKRQAKDIVKKAADDAKMPYVNSRWLGGTLTNFDTIKKRIEKYRKIKEELKSDKAKNYIKKEKVRLQKEVARMDKFFLGLEKMDKMPDVLFVVDPSEEHVALKEAKIKKIPVVALANTNIDFTKLEYPIVGNDNAPKTIEFIVNYIAEIIKENKKK